MLLRYHVMSSVASLTIDAESGVASKRAGPTRKPSLIALGFSLFVTVHACGGTMQEHSDIEPSQVSTRPSTEGGVNKSPSEVLNPARQANSAPQIAEYVVETFEDRYGHLWFGTIDKGVARYDGKALTYFTQRDGLCGDTVTSIAEDKGGRLWFGTHTGVSKYDPLASAERGESRFTTILNSEGSVRAGRDGTIWISSNTRIHRASGSVLAEFAVPVDRAKVASYSIVPGRVRMELEDRQGNLWFATDGAGALRFDGTTFRHFTKEDGLCSNTVWSIIEDAKGGIWFACIQAFQPRKTGDGGVCRYDGKTFTRFPDVKGLSGNDIYTIYPERSGQIWIGATGVGAYRHDGKTFTLHDQVDKRERIQNFGVQSILEDRSGVLWFGFSGGLFRFDGATFRNVTQEGPWTRR